jgi:hypothetical protein
MPRFVTVSLSKAKLPYGPIMKLLSRRSASQHAPSPNPNDSVKTEGLIKTPKVEAI